MKVGTDSVILGAWAELADCRNILDIGTGTGILALMAAQKSPEATVTAVEIDGEAAAQAAQNAACSPWSHRISVICQDIREYLPGCRYDAILCNPPYFRKSLHSPDSGRNTARHDDTLDYASLASCASVLLSDGGAFHIILPTDGFDAFCGAAASCGMQLTAITALISREGKPPFRKLGTFRKHYSDGRNDSLTISDRQGNPTEEYIRLVKDFYIRI